SAPRVASLAQPREGAITRAMGRDLGEDLAREHVEVARSAELASEPAQLRPEVAHPFARQEASKHRQRRARPPDADAHLVYALGIDAFGGTIRVGGEVFEALREDRDQRILERC